jgi:glutathione S-transferase
MAQLFHHPLCPHSRFIRLLLGEYGIEPDLVEERVFERRTEFLVLNPAGQTPVLVEHSGLVVPGAATIAEYLDETRGLALGDRRLLPADPGGRAPDMALVRAARSNIRYHLRYIGYLIGRRNWLAGTTLTHADLAAAAHLSSVDFLGDVPWDEDEAAKQWYARVKSRPAFRALLADRIPGLMPAAVYADLDF